MCVWFETSGLEAPTYCISTTHPTSAPEVSGISNGTIVAIAVSCTVGVICFLVLMHHFFNGVHPYKKTPADIDAPNFNNDAMFVELDEFQNPVS
jgi:hypothetical protein